MSHDRAPPDHGPDLRQTLVKGPVAGWVRNRKGELVRDAKGRKKPLVITLRRPDVLVEDRPDPKQPNVTIRGARRRDGLRLMWKRGQLSDAQMAAAEKYRDDAALASGARLSLPGDRVSTRTRGRNFEPPMAAVDALSRCRGAWKAVGLLSQPVVSWIVIGWGTVGGYAECKHMRDDRAAVLLKRGLDGMADYYTALTPRSKGANGR